MSPETRELLDCFGRRYVVGPTAEEAGGGRPRAWQLWAAVAAMAAVGVLQYGYGALAPGLLDRGWSAAEVFGLLALWTVFQAATGFPVAYLRERGRIGPRSAMLTGAVLTAAGLPALAHGSVPVALAGFSVLAGTGAGLVYATCSSTVAKWYPERSAASVSLATGAFAFGCVPFVVAFAVATGTGGLSPVLVVAGLLLAAVVAAAGLLFRDPPADWWPPKPDPREWALRRHGPAAARQFSSREALRTGALTRMCVILLCASAVSLLDVAFLATVAVELGLGLVIAAVGTCLLVGVNGTGRSLAIRVAERIGLRSTLRLVLALLGTGQVLLAGAAASGSAVLLLIAALVAGAGGGAFYPLFAELARECFGDRAGLEVNAVIYSAKALGGLAGVGAGAALAHLWGYPAVFLGAGTVALGAAALCQGLRRPGLLRVIPATPVVVREA
ncbi:MFS transporter [Amycolatopsis suaedae]|nr:MFS transporter [Amycolatopsis suaedae]